MAHFGTQFFFKKVSVFFIVDKLVKMVCFHLDKHYLCSPFLKTI